VASRERKGNCGEWGKEASEKGVKRRGKGKKKRSRIGRGVKGIRPTA
jgi:hypothetical protein